MTAPSGVTLEPVAAEVIQELTAADRCDRCGAEAKHVWQFAAGVLMWCNHHAREYAKAIPVDEALKLP